MLNKNFNLCIKYPNQKKIIANILFLERLSIDKAIKFKKLILSTSSTEMMFILIHN